jgi:hypothetical protein
MASYAVIMGHLSPRSFAAAMSRTVTLRPAWPPYSVAGRPGVVVFGALPVDEETEDM